MNEVIETCASTNNLARAFAEKGAPHGTWISALEQTAGRGRHGRSWLSEKGGLYLSVVLVPPTGFGDLQWVPLAVAVGVCDALQDPRVKIKWPNDLWIGPRKLGGILCEGSSGAQPWIVAGIGINCENSPDPAELIRPAEKLGKPADEIRKAIVDAVTRRTQELFSQGPGAIKLAFETLSVIREGSKLTWKDAKTGQEKSGKFLSLNDSAELEVEMKEPNALQAATVRLNSEEIISVTP